MYESLLCHESVILIVDDQVSDIQLLGDAARGLGMIHFATNGVQALELARQVRPDLVLLDIEMSGMDGFQLCEALKSDAKLTNTAMIFVTAHHNTEHEVHALELGGVDFLTKPVNVPVARARIRNHVRLQQMAKALANQDALTGLPNRLLLQDRISQAIHKARRHDGRVALMMLDLDNFRKINDAEGLAVGDKLLQRVAGRLSECSRVEDTVSRSGSDEFIILLPEVSSAGAVGNFAQRLLNAMSKPFVMDSGTYTLSVTIGISLYPDDNNDAESIFQHAETALYQAKAGGRNRYSFFSSEIESCMRARHRQERQIQAALEHGGFEVFYQAKVEASQKKIIGVEALIRWRDNKGNLISPADFIPLAEKTGQIIPIGRLVLHRACRDAHAWHKAGHRLCVSVNISAVQLKYDHFIADVRDILQETGVNPGLVELEITEGVLATREHGSQDALLALKRLGLRIAIDDFGTGYSNLAYLKMFPVDVLKIDQSFVRGMMVDHSDTVIIEAIIKLGKALGLELVAEGVETREQEQGLIKLGCTVMQGFYYCRPAPHDEVDRQLASGIAGFTTIQS